MHDLLAGARYDELELEPYWAEFNENFWLTDSSGFWKLERQQHFREPGYDTWEAFARGDWEESLRLLEGHRPALEAEHRRAAALGFAIRRVRVVEEPIGPYLQWELHVLRLREECGTGVRIVRSGEVARLEQHGLLPEIYTLGTRIMYQALYDDLGVLHAVRRYTDPPLIERAQRLIADLYSAGEPLEDYFAREVAVLPPPTEQSRFTMT